jgi:tetratricopeptide (TPR) repeat protein
LRNLLFILFCAIFVGGCGETLKNSWGNFRAYYNTYYNAKENFQAGLKKVQDQPFTIDPSEPVRVHHTPFQAGNNDFQKAIDKGATILRKFPDTKWVDDAILLIGKSYYYRHEFYPALEKFEELRDAASSPKMEQLSIIWKGRTLLDLNFHAEGITFLESELEEYPEDWSIGRKGEIQVLAGEHHAMLGNWEESVDFLSDAVANIKNKELLGRTYFLYGQVLERVELYGEAYFSFSRVSETFPGFEYSYWARFKQADVARKENNLDLAISIYEELSIDDKNADRRSKLVFEIARTLEMKGEVAEAEKRYKNLLYDERRQGIQNIEADIYYRLGKIYSENYDNLSVAASYFDSSSTSSETLTRIETTRDPQNLSDVFGEYKRIRNTIDRADSLLRLGSLSPGQLDSALKKIRAQKRRELLEQQGSESESQNTLANRNLTSSDNQNGTSSSRYGFLNFRNADLVSQSKAEFRAIWGERPLVDNWRRIRGILGSSVSGDQSLLEESRRVDEQEGDKTAVVMDIGEIPRTPEAKENLKHEKVNAQYNLGNLLFLSLDSPDEARKYFYEVINNQVDQELRPRAMYSLYELFKTGENQDSLKFWQDKILHEYPDSRYARRIQNNSDKSSNDPESEGRQKLVKQFQQIESSRAENKAEKLRKLALENRSSELAPHIHYRAIEMYIEQAKAFDIIADSLELPIQGISVDTTGSHENSLQSSSNIDQQFSFNSAYWDSVLSAVQEFDTTFPDTQRHKKVVQLLKILEQNESSSQIPTCEDLDISLSVKPSMDEFLSTVTYPDEVRDMSISGQVVYSFVVTPYGDVQSFDLISQRTSLGIEEAFESSFEQSLLFEPLNLEDPPPTIRCEVSFPIEY